MKNKQAHGVQPIYCPAIASSPNIRHGFFTRQGGVSDGIYTSLNVGLGSNDDTDKVKQNRELVAAYFNQEADKLHTLYQVHSSDVVTITEESPFVPGQEADALVTNVPNIILGALTADCCPVLFADPEHNVIGAAHAGWKGAISGVLEATLEAMQKLGATFETTYAAIGPTIQQLSYEVDAGFKERFNADDENNDQFFIPSPKEGHFMFDLPGFVTAKLNGFPLKEVTNMKRDTYQEEELFYSFRRTTHRQEADYGRQISAIMLLNGNR